MSSAGSPKGPAATMALAMTAASAPWWTKPTVPGAPAVLATTTGPLPLSAPAMGSTLTPSTPTSGNGCPHEGTGGQGENPARLLQAAHFRHPLAALGRDHRGPAAGRVLHPPGIYRLPAMAFRDGGPAMDRPRRGVFLLPQYGQV